MIFRKRALIVIFSILCFLNIFIFSDLLLPSSVQAQYWASLPPYNVLWPLWSPPLSPLDPVTGVSTPLITSLTSNTILPVQPALAWDPVAYALKPPWALYNIPAAFGGGLAFYDFEYGLNPWPPSYLVDSTTGSPSPIALPLGWSLILPTGLGHLEYFIPIANLTYAVTYGITPAEYLSLLTSAQIWGLPPISPI